MDKNRCFNRIIPVLMAASVMLSTGCSGKTKADDSIFVEIAAPTLAPMATLAITPSPTPVTLIAESNTPKPTRPPTPTPEPTPKPTPKPTEKPKESSGGESGSSSGGSFKDTPNKNNYSKVSIKSASGKAGKFSSQVINGSGNLTQDYFAQGEITLVNYWSTT